MSTDVDKLAAALGTSRQVVEDAIRELRRRLDAPAMTDIDRLHGVVLGERTGRRAGHTFAHCHEVASLIELGETEVVVVLPRLDWVRHVRPMLLRVLEDRGLGVPKHPRASLYSFEIAGCLVRFMTSSQPGFMDGLRGAVVEVTG